jgi:hypothetical protein
MTPGVEGVPGLTVTARVLAALFPQELLAKTVIFPPVVPVLTVMEVVDPPPVIDHPVGTVQVYVVAFGTGVILYTCPVTPGH